MKLSTLNSKLNLLAVGSNAKTIKSDNDNQLTAILYLAPSTNSGYNTCPKASPGCTAACLYTAGRGKFSTVQNARIRKTKLFFEDRNTFLKQLHSDLSLFENYCKDNDIKPFVRLNGTSDISWEKYGIFDKYPNIQFYDYTKILNRKVSKYSNYHLTFSRSEDTKESDIVRAFSQNMNTTIVFKDEIPVTWKIQGTDYKVIDGDLNDLRPLDEPNVIVALKAKGDAKSDTSGFVIHG